MRVVRYRITGPRQPNFSAEGTVRELLSWMGGVLFDKYIPPRSVVNDAFRQGHISNGTSGDTYWEPFELTADEYAALVAELLADETMGLQTLDAPDWVENEIDWAAYKSWYQFGVPVEEHRRMLYEVQALVKKSEQAEADGDKNSAFAFKLQMVEAANKMAAYLKKYYR